MVSYCSDIHVGITLAWDLGQDGLSETMSYYAVFAANAFIDYRPNSYSFNIPTHFCSGAAFHALLGLTPCPF